MLCGGFDGGILFRGGFFGCGFPAAAPACEGRLYAAKAAAVFPLIIVPAAHIPAGIFPLFGMIADFFSGLFICAERIICPDAEPNGPQARPADHGPARIWRHRRSACRLSSCLAERHATPFLALCPTLPPARFAARQRWLTAC